MSVDNRVDQIQVDDNSAIKIANSLLERFGITKKINCIKDCDDEYFLTLYEAITGEVPLGVIKNPHRKDDRITNCQLIIEGLSNEILETDLSHIQANDIIDCNVVSVANLLEIFMGLLEYIFEELQKEEEEDRGLKQCEEDHEDDSNLLPSDHEILSDVLEEEFGAAEKESKTSGEKYREGSQNIMDKYLLPSEALTCDTDTETVSSHDFTQDSLYDPKCKTIAKGGNTIENIQRTFDIHPFAYVSSSSSNSTENLAKEAGTFHKKGRRKKGADMNSASTTKVSRIAHEEDPRYKSAFRKTDPVLCTSISKRRYQGAASPERSMSSANWPSILNTHELDSKSAGNLYKDIGKRPRDPLPFEANKEVDNSSDTSSFRHQHTHHHYHHYSAPLPTNSRPKLSNSSVGRGSPPKSTVKTVKSDMHDGISSESKRLTMQEKIKSKGDVSSIIIGETRLNFNKKEIPDKENESIRMRSVQTSVSGLETSGLWKPGKSTVKISKEKLNENGVESDRSSVSELNELLNIRKELGTKDASKSDVLDELNDKLERVRSGIRTIDKNRSHISDAKREDIESLKDHDRLADDWSQSPLGNRILSGNDSICSDSEFDYDYVHRRTQSFTVGNEESRKIHQDSNQPSLKSPRATENDKIALRQKSKKKVQFTDFKSESRDERLERLIKSLKKEEKENKEKIDTVKNRYSNDLMNAQKKYSVKYNDARKKDCLPKKTLQSITPNKGASRLAKVYGQRSRAVQRGVGKQRKRSASCSPIPRTRRKGRLVIDEEDIIPLMEEEFPQLYLSPVTAKMMWQKQMRQISNLAKAAHLRRPTIVEQRIEESKKKQEALVNIMKKEIEHNRRMKEAKKKADEQRQVKNKLRDRRLASARARRYYDDYQVRIRSRLMKRKTKEEKIFKKLFEDALEIQKERIRELREYAREQRTIDAQRKKNELESIDNFYRDQFAMMAESVARDRYEIEVREKAQRKVIETMRKGIRQRMEKDIKDLQEQLARDEDSAYFRQLDADTLRRELQLATYKVRM